MREGYRWRREHDAYLMAWQTARLMNATGNFKKPGVQVDALFTELTGHKLNEPDKRSGEDLLRDWEDLKRDFARSRKHKARGRTAA